MAVTWEALRKEARRLETEIDSKLVDYSKLLANANAPVHARASSFDNLRVGDGTQAAPSASLPALRVRGTHTLTGSESVPAAALQRRTGPGARESALAAALAAAEAGTAELDTLLARLAGVIDALSGATDGAAPPASRAHTVQRHSEILHDYQKEFRKTRKAVSALRDSAELLSGAGAPRAAAQTASTAGAADALHAERVALAGASAAADAATGAGLSLKEDLERQRAMFASMVERMETMSEGIPAVNRLIGQIRRKKKRDVLIVAAVVATLLFVTFSWKLAR